MLSGDNGILQRATDAKTNTDNAQIKERIQLAYLACITGGNGSIDKGSFLLELQKEFGAENVTEDNIVESVDGKTWTVTIDGAVVELAAGSTTTPQIPEIATLPTGDGTTPYFPKTDGTWHQVDGTTLTNGLVITDEIDEEGNSIGNEYVWIEVPRTATTYGSSFNLNYDFDNMTAEQKNTAYTAIAAALRTYCTKDLGGANFITVTDGTEATKDYKTTTAGYTDTWYSGCGIANSGEYDNLYYAMLKSVYENGGFWIGRYEAGTGIVRKSGDSASGIIPLSKIDKYPINFVKCGEAQTIAGSVLNKGNYNSSLMFGIQWDLVLRYLSNKGVTTTVITEDSSTWGNYSGVEITTTRGSIWDFSKYSAGFVAVNGSYTKQSRGAPVCFTTGAIPISMIKQNIYDLAGNIFEWTLEKTSSDGKPCALRGGCFSDTGSKYPASCRYYLDTSSDSNIRFQSIYLLGQTCN